MARYPVNTMNYYPYGGFHPNEPHRAPSNYENNYGGGKSNNTTTGRKSKNEGKNKSDSNTSKTQGGNYSNRKKEKKNAFEETKSKTEKTTSPYTKQQSSDTQSTDPMEVERLIENAAK